VWHVWLIQQHGLQRWMWWGHLRGGHLRDLDFLWWGYLRELHDVWGILLWIGVLRQHRRRLWRFLWECLRMWRELWLLRAS